MAVQDFRIEGFTVAVTDMVAMAEFYKGVFGATFTEESMFGTTLMKAKIGGYELLFCPAEVAGNTAKQNRQQFTFVVNDMQEAINAALANGGNRMGEVAEKEGFSEVGILDPDKNTIVFKAYDTPVRNKPKITGIGGVFMKSPDPEALKAWYGEHFGVISDQYGGVFQTRSVLPPHHKQYLQWSPFPDSSTYFEPSEKGFMINYRVAGIELLVEKLQAAGVTIVDEIKGYDYGKFVHVMDPDGNNIELWEPVDRVFDEGYDAKANY